MNEKWFGTPGHFIGSKSCRFHLTTSVNGFLVSTVGEYCPSPLLVITDIGIDRKYETMVFHAGEECNAKVCGKCGMPSIDGMEIEMRGYNTAREANEGHIALVKKYRRKK